MLIEQAAESFHMGRNRPNVTKRLYEQLLAVTIDTSTFKFSSPLKLVFTPLIIES